MNRAEFQELKQAKHETLIEVGKQLTSVFVCLPILNIDFLKPAQVCQMACGIDKNRVARINPHNREFYTLGNDLSLVMRYV